MKQFTKPTNLNGTELIQELAAVGIVVEKIFVVDDKIQFDTDDEKTASEIVTNHNGTVVAPEISIEEKLASVGLSLPDLKIALGL